MKVVEEQRVHVMDGEWDVLDVAREITEGGAQEDPFYLMDLGVVVDKHRQWTQAMPRVQPFYAVKCNDETVLLRALAALGTGFDCASKAEMEAVLQLGVEPERIIFANPAKMASHIRYARAASVNTMTFDSETELLKIKHYMPEAKLVIRMRCDATDAQCPLGIKFGCDPVAEAPRLLKVAALLHLDVVGVSFHVGSGARDPAVYARAIELARALFEEGADAGHARMRLLDIGGGFPGHAHSTIDDVASVVNGALKKHFPDPRVQVIAEPGRYYAAAAFTLFTQLYSKRELPTKNEAGENHVMYFVNDGVYGSFNCILYDHQVVCAETLKPNGGQASVCSVWGPSCDGLDCIVGAALLPALQVGEWLVWRDMGAYTLPVASPFNGFPLPKVRALCRRQLWESFKEQFPMTECHFVVGERLTGPQESTPPPSPPPPQPQDSAPCAVFVECALK